mgnify:CR=1 FL=1
MADFEFFKKEFEFKGKHAKMAQELWVRDDTERTYFKRLIDLYVAAAVVGFRVDRKAEEDYSPFETSSIFPEQMLKEKENLDFILQMMIMLNYRGTLTDEECVKKAFQGAQTKEEFEQMIAEHQLIEYAQYVGNYYGTPKEYVVQQLEQGKDVILEIEIQGAMKIKEKIPEALLVFVTPPTVEELERRLTGRGTETAQVIADRLARAGEEAEGMGQYDYILVNDTVEECVDHLHQIIVSEHSRASRNAEFIADIQKQTKAFQK